MLSLKIKMCLTHLQVSSKVLFTVSLILLVSTVAFSRPPSSMSSLFTAVWTVIISLALVIIFLVFSRPFLVVSFSPFSPIKPGPSLDKFNFCIKEKIKINNYTGYHTCNNWLYKMLFFLTSAPLAR